MISKTFTGKIGLEVKGDTRTCVNLPGSKEVFSTGKAVKVKGTVDGHPIQIGLLPNGQGDHMLSLNKQILKKIDKQLGDSVTVFIEDLI